MFTAARRVLLRHFVLNFDVKFFGLVLGHIFERLLVPSTILVCTKILGTNLKALEQAWAILRCLVAMIYLDMKKLLPGAEILYNRTIYSLKINSRTEKNLVPTCDLQIGPIVLEEDLGIS
jgi:hypothetical protein